MANFLFAWELGGGTGHCINVAPIMQGLAELGHQVYFAARDLHVARRVVADERVRLLQAPFLRGRPVAPIQRPATFAHILHNVGFGDDHQFEPMVAAWRQLIELTHSSVLVCEHAPTALVAGRFSQVKRVVAGSGFICPPGASPFPDFSAAPPHDRAPPWIEQSMVDRINRLAGHRSIEQLATIYSDVDDQLLLTFSELDHYPQRGVTAYWGTWTPKGGATPAWGSAIGPRIFAYFQPGQYGWRPETVLPIIRTLPANSLIYAPNFTRIELAGYMDTNLVVEHKRLDMEAVCRQCDIAITHGNNGTATQLLLAGIPQLLMPIFLEQVIFARRIESLGAGVVVPPSATSAMPSRLAALLHDASYTIAARNFSEKYRSFYPEESIRKIVDRLDRLAMK